MRNYEAFRVITLSPIDQSSLFPDSKSVVFFFSLVHLIPGAFLGFLFYFRVKSRPLSQKEKLEKRKGWGGKREGVCQEHARKQRRSNLFLPSVT